MTGGIDIVGLTFLRTVWLKVYDSCVSVKILNVPFLLFSSRKRNSRSKGIEEIDGSSTVLRVWTNERTAPMQSYSNCTVLKIAIDTVQYIKSEQMKMWRTFSFQCSQPKKRVLQTHSTCSATAEPIVQYLMLLDSSAVVV